MKDDKLGERNITEFIFFRNYYGKILGHHWNLLDQVFSNFTKT
jgi:hypothetical protein